MHGDWKSHKVKVRTLGETGSKGTPQKRVKSRPGAANKGHYQPRQNRKQIVP